ncbi:site-2 protease family protein [Helicobacter sp. 23-1045]
MKIAVLLIAIIGHEIMHGFVALKYGDTTAKIAGRLSINPIRHIDIFGSILLPLGLFLLNAPFLFGWAKPVPVDIRKVIENGDFNGAIAVSLAGIAYNLFIALVAAIILRAFFTGELQGGLSAIVAYFLALCVIYNVILAVFNLLPIPPLDGAQAVGYLSLKFGSDTIPLFFNKIERFGIVIVMAVLFFGAKFLAIPINALINLFLA